MIGVKIRYKIDPRHKFFDDTKESRQNGPDCQYNQDLI